MGRFIKQKTAGETVRSIVDSLFNLSFMSKLYLIFFMFLLVAIVIGTVLSNQRRSVENFASEPRKREPYIEKLLKYIHTYFAPQE